MFIKRSVIKVTVLDEEKDKKELDKVQKITEANLEEKSKSLKSENK